VGKAAEKMNYVVDYSLIVRKDAYQTNTITEHATGGKGIQDIDSPLKPCHNPAIVSSKVTERLRLLLKDVKHRVGRFATFKPVEYLMLNKVSPCPVLDFIQGIFKE